MFTNHNQHTINRVFIFHLLSLATCFPIDWFNHEFDWNKLWGEHNKMWTVKPHNSTQIILCCNFLLSNPM